MIYMWTRLPNETSKAFEAFELYRDMGPKRSIQKVGERLAKNAKALARLSKRYHWVERANAFDAYVGERKAEDRARELVEMNRRHAEWAQAFEELALEPLKELKARVADGTSPFFDEGFRTMKTERLAEFALKSFRVFRLAASMERAARHGQEPENASPLENGSEFLTTIENGDLSEQNPALSEDALVRRGNDSTRPWTSAYPNSKED